MGLKTEEGHESSQQKKPLHHRDQLGARPQDALWLSTKGNTDLPCSVNASGAVDVKNHYKLVFLPGYYK